MSIHIIQNGIDYADLGLDNHTLSLNSSKTSNIITLSTGLEKALIKYADKYSVGASATNGKDMNEFIIVDDAHNNSSFKIASFNSDMVNIYNKLNISHELDVKDLIVSKDNNTIINKNIVMNLTDTSHTLQVFNKDQKSVFQIAHNDSRVSNLLRVDRIAPINANGYVTIEQFNLGSTLSQTVKSIFSLEVDNTGGVYEDKTPLKIQKYEGVKDFVRISTISQNSGNTKNEIFTIDKNGMIGIGTSLPNAAISISKSNTFDNIIQYNGPKYGDKFHLSSIGNLGIGTLDPRGRLHVKRTDDYESMNYRSHPVVKIDMEYDSNKNISNILLEDKIVDLSSTSTCNLYLLDSNDSKYILLPNNLYNNLLEGDITNMTNCNYIRSEKLVTKSRIINGNPVQYRSKLSIGLLSSDEISAIRSSVTDSNIDFGDSNQINLTYFIDSNLNLSSLESAYTTFSYKIDTFNLYNESKTLWTDKFISEPSEPPSLSLYITLKIRNNDSNQFKYDKLNFQYKSTVQLPPPDLLYLSTKNNFMASISADGRLSLGDIAPASCNYLIYSPGNSYVDNLITNYITTEADHISFDNQNISNINIMHCKEISTNNINTKFDIYSSNIYIDGDIFISIDGVSKSLRSLFSVPPV